MNNNNNNNNNNGGNNHKKCFIETRGIRKMRASNSFTLCSSPSPSPSTLPPIQACNYLGMATSKDPSPHYRGKSSSMGVGIGAGVGGLSSYSYYACLLCGIMFLVGCCGLFYASQLLDAPCGKSPTILVHHPSLGGGRGREGRIREGRIRAGSIREGEIPRGGAPPPLDLLRMGNVAWNDVVVAAPRTRASPDRRSYTRAPSPKLRIAAFVRKWPDGANPGGLERHALTLHGGLASLGHEIHVFTHLATTTNNTHLTNSSNSSSNSGGGDIGKNIVVHSTTRGKIYDQSEAWEQFLALNRSSPFDIIHSESVAVAHSRAAGLPNLVVTWHGIAFEVVHADLVQDLLRSADDQVRGIRTPDLQRTMSSRLFKVVDEIRFFSSYRHHVAISHHVGDILRTIYQLPEGSVHTILNGVNETEFRPSPEDGRRFRERVGIPTDARLVLGVAGRLVKDKGHPILFEAMMQLLANEHTNTSGVYLLIAGDGPWASRYKSLSPTHVKVLGAMVPSDMASFYNSLDIFVNPTLRSQGLDLTLLEAMLCGKTLLATHFSSITRSVIVSPDIGYTFYPNAPSLLATLQSAIRDVELQPGILREKGATAFRRALSMFTAKAMVMAYERLFLCIKDASFCKLNPTY